MEITLKPILQQEYELRFSIVKEAIYEHVDAVFGWDDDFQRKRLIDEYDPTWFYWIYNNDHRIGMLCYKPYDNSYHVHLLIVFPDFQNQGLGYMTMDYVHQLAQAEQRKSITLSSFIRNEKAVKFYKKLGYDITNVESDFYVLTRHFSAIE
ncbi:MULTISPECIES: GNAT family N-acetyltransferase [Marinomonas]|uniref:GNAT family N-acetyltransferase n=1 Tax=Marinomonas arctica TaxID=383750 RepID=A0A7H1J1E1_9GAMM|nr:MULTISPECIES: GNAT family N-acetyltransferase [Marinomonas]QNT04307.1 GNAT family N-acetyltransferase [Marinomonas arctica]GGN37776.1 N-acetyltransferase [Marinomonas arctica]